MPTVPPAPKDKLPNRFSRWLEQLREILRPLPEFREGSGTPEGAVAAPRGTRFYRTDGGAGTRLYVKTTTTGNTGWVAYG